MGRKNTAFLELFMEHFIVNERTFSEQAHDTPRLPTMSYWQQYIHEI
jgi:hypothetical protein